MNNYISSGASIDIVLPNQTPAGVPYIHGSLVGIPVSDGDGVNPVAVQLRGVYKLPKASGAITAGAKVYWKAADNNIVTSDSGNTFVGYAVAAAASADTQVDVVLGNGV